MTDRFSRRGLLGRVRGAVLAVMAAATRADASQKLRTLVRGVLRVGTYFVNQTPGLRILAQVPNDLQPLGIGFNRRNPGLLGAVDRVLAEMQRDGRYAALAGRWDVP